MAVIASAGIGTSYAAYSREFKIGDNNQNHLLVGISAICTDDPDSNPDPQHFPGHNDELKHVATTTCENRTHLFSRWIGGKNIDFYNEMLLTIENAYPWYSTGVAYYLVNGDSIKNVKITTILRATAVQDPEIEPNLLLKFLQVHYWTIHHNGVFYKEGYSHKTLKQALKEIVLGPSDFLRVYVGYHFEQEYTDCYGVHEMPQGGSIRYRDIFIWKEVTPGLMD